ncbi:MAG: hypothetical protein HY791_06460 [Deltaproteobacteria bacterium]|nr:hypothetical protein [Deltaproteobacteria bacterium]
MRSLARFVSVAGHPFLLIPLSIALATSEAASTAGFRALLSLTLGSLLVVGALVLFGRWRGWWSHIDVPERDRRAPLYGAAIVTTALSTAALELIGQPSVVVRGSLVATGMLALSLALNRFALKVSLHTAMAVYSAGILGVNLGGTALLGVAVLVGWSRVVLGRHTPREVLAGFAVGLLACAALLVR